MLKANVPYEEIEAIQKYVQESDFVCSPYDSDLLGCYTVRSYLFQHYVHDANIVAIIDRNLVFEYHCSC